MQPVFWLELLLCLWLRLTTHPLDVVSIQPKETFRWGMAKWRSLEEYTPFARLLVQYMWEQRPSLLPNQFAERMGVRKQALSTWLNSDVMPAPQVAVRLARGMGRPVRELMTAAGFAPGDDPLLDTADAWVYVLDEAQRVLGVDAEGMAELEAGHDAEGEGADAPAPANVAVVPPLPETRDALLMLLRQLQARTLAITKAGMRAPEDLSLSSKPVDGAGALDDIDSANEATSEHA
jgi:transcriptional regulator with XRE-family HTH domain